MMAKITKGSSFKGVIKYIIDEKKKSQILDADGLRLKSISSVIGSFVTQAEMNGRVSKTVGHISLDFSAQDKDKISNRFMVNVAHDYMKQMDICNTQYILVRHFDKEHPHVHLVFNRVDYNGRIISDSNDRYRSEKICKDITHRHGLYFSTGKENVKLHRLKEPDKSKYEIYNTIKDSVPRCRNWQELTRELHKAGIETEFKTKGNTAIIEGVKFRKEIMFLTAQRWTGCLVIRKLIFSSNRMKDCLNSRCKHSRNNMRWERYRQLRGLGAL